jgi:methyl-accepting chemotaxis protein
MRFSIYGKVTGLFLAAILVVGGALGLGCLGVIGQLETDMADAAATPPEIHWQRARGVIILYTLLSTTAVLLTGILVLRHWLQRPMRRMVTGVDRLLGQGDFHQRIQVQHPGDLGHLAQTINHMADDLRSLASESGGPTEQLTSKEERRDYEE